MAKNASDSHCNISFPLHRVQSPHSIHTDPFCERLHAFCRFTAMLQQIEALDCHYIDYSHA